MAQQLYVVGFLFDEKKQRVVVIKKNKPDWQKGKLNGVGGKIEPGELASVAMKREFLEEAGIEIENWTEFLIVQDFNEEYYKMFVYKATATTAQLKKIESKTDEEVTIINIRDIPMLNTIQNLNWMIQMALDHEVEHSSVFYK